VTETQKIHSPAPRTLTNEALLEMGRAVIQTEADAVNALLARIDQDFVRACRFMQASKGRVVVTGMGKSGHIGGKIAATLASTGTPAFFVHPGEASHGDLGMITEGDVIIAISNSGETHEILTIVPLIKRLKVPLIALTGKSSSNLARIADVHIDVSVAKEACPLGLAPTASTTATLAMGDALAIALLESKGFTEEDFAYSHPGGTLGRKLLLRVEDLMHKNENVPFIPHTASVAEALKEMTRINLGFAVVVDFENKVLGVFTDGDLRRLLMEPKNIHGIPITDAMIANCTSIKPNILVAEALQIMQSKKINAFPVTNENNELIGALNMSDILRAGVI